jgi:hypothetical protein
MEAFDSVDLQVRAMTPTETVTVDQLADAVKANDRDRVRQILDAQPDLVRTDMAYENEHQVLHYAVYARLTMPVRVGQPCRVAREEKCDRLLRPECAGQMQHQLAFSSYWSDECCERRQVAASKEISNYDALEQTGHRGGGKQSAVSVSCPKGP